MLSDLACKNARPAAKPLMAACLAPILAAMFPAHAMAITGTAAAVGVLAGTYGTLKGVPTEQDA
eukprot:gene7248-8984_t